MPLKVLDFVSLVSVILWAYPEQAVSVIIVIITDVINTVLRWGSKETVLQIDKLYIVVRRIFELTFQTVVLRHSEWPHLCRWLAACTQCTWDIKNNYEFCEHGMFNIVKKICESKFYPKYFMEHCQQLFWSYLQKVFVQSILMLTVRQTKVESSLSRDDFCLTKMYLP